MLACLSVLLSLASAQDADVRFLSVSSDAGDLDVTVDGASVGTGVGYLEGTSTVALVPSFASVEVSEAGSGGSNVYASTLVDLAADTHNDLVAFGPVNDMGIVTLIDDGAGIDPGTNRLQFAHLAEGTPDVDVYLPATDTVVADDLPFGANDTLDIEVTGPFTVMVDIDDDEGADFIFDLPDLGSEQLVSLLLIGEGEELSFVVWRSDGTLGVFDGVFIPKPTVQFVHLSPDMPAADVFIGFGFDPFFENISFGMASEPTPIKRGLHGFTLAPTGVPPTSPYGEGSTRLDAETDYTVFAFSVVDDLRYGAVIDPEPVPGEAGLRVLHTALGVGPMQILRDGAVIKDFVTRGGGLEDNFGMGAFELGFDNTFDGVAEWTFAVPDYGDGFVNAFLATSEALETRLYVDLPDGTLLVLDPL